MRVFVTGGTGFLGKRLVRRLLAGGMDVSCLSRTGSGGEALPSAEGGGRLRIVPGSLSRIDDLADALAQCDVVIHAAAAMTGGAPVLFLNNVVATRRLIELVRNIDLKRFVLVSSLGVYANHGLRPGEVLDERCPLDPKPHLRDAYSYSKIAQEQVAWEAREAWGLPLVVIRPGVIYGPDRGCLSSRIGLQLGNTMLKMGGRQRVPYTYVDNCADAIASAVTAPGIEGEAFNIIDDDLPRASSVLSFYRKRVKRGWVVPIPGPLIGPLSGLNEWYHAWSRGQLPAVLTRYKSQAMWKPLRYSNEKAKTRLGWTPQVKFDQGLPLSCPT